MLFTYPWEIFFFDESVVVHRSVDWPCVHVNGHIAIGYESTVHWSGHLDRVRLIRVENVSRSRWHHLEKWDVIMFDQELIVVNLLHGFGADRPVSHTRIRWQLVRQRHNSWYSICFNYLQLNKMKSLEFNTICRVTRWPTTNDESLRILRLIII